jgi:hypothetical protein
VRRSLRGETFVSAQEAFRITRSLPDGHLEAVLGMLRKLGLETLVASKRSRERDLAVAMIVQRVLFPCSKRATTRDWHSTTLAEALEVADARVNELYAALDWLLADHRLRRAHLLICLLAYYVQAPQTSLGETRASWQASLLLPRFDNSPNSIRSRPGPSNSLACSQNPEPTLSRNAFAEHKIRRKRNAELRFRRALIGRAPWWPTIPRNWRSSARAGRRRRARRSRGSRPLSRGRNARQTAGAA